jgi:CRISPR/Cas system CSM-associated protein Csm5 (group 7 of RAMP superfamily)
MSKKKIQKLQVRKFSFFFNVEAKHLAREEEFKTLREEVKNYQAQVAQSKRLYEEKLQLQNDKKAIYSAPFLKNALQEKLNESDDVAYEISSKFLSGNLKAENFLNDFIKERNLYYVRKTKLDRFQ